MWRAEGRRRGSGSRRCSPNCAFESPQERLTRSRISCVSFVFVSRSVREFGGQWLGLLVAPHARFETFWWCCSSLSACIASRSAWRVCARRMSGAAYAACVEWWSATVASTPSATEDLSPQKSKRRIAVTRVENVSAHPRPVFRRSGDGGDTLARQRGPSSRTNRRDGSVSVAPCGAQRRNRSPREEVVRNASGMRWSRRGLGCG